MPELPDVEGFKRVLAKNAPRETIARVVVSDARILDKLSARTFAARLQNANKVVVLEGKVDNWDERRAVENAAWSATEVSSVDDRLTIA